MARIRKRDLKLMVGRPYPLGAACFNTGVRFTIFSRHATQVWICLYEHAEDQNPVVELELDPAVYRTGDIWSVYIHGVTVGVYYKYRMDGPHNPVLGHHYSAKDYLLDPYAKAFVGELHDGTMKCVAVHDIMHWEQDARPKIPMRNTIIYETHVRGFTKDASAGVAHGGTYRGLVEKIPYLKSLGVTTVELLPIQEFGENWLGRCSLETGAELTNYWGYSSIGFFAPAGRYACSAVEREHLAEFRELVKGLHQAGMEVILDVVFNHTSEGDERGPTLCFRGIDNSIYYLLDNAGNYFNYSGCGNTVSCNHPLVRDFILDCLRYWVAVMHVDGFRFDLASILGRDQSGNIRVEAPLIERIAQDPVLRDTKLIAEAWDAGGGYQVGSFGVDHVGVSDMRWAEWNGQYRDDVRRYWRGDRNTRAAFASRLTGSADLYEDDGRSPEHSINFITAHDGFTLHDLVSYSEKHNLANGEGNRDGSDHDHSFNCGVEGETDDPAIQALRMKMQKNFLATLFLSVGVPMLLGGDEFGRTQRGNNNAYCQDNEISWYDWALLEENAALFRFCQGLIAFRKANPALQRGHHFNGRAENQQPDLVWFGPGGREVDWASGETPLAFQINALENGGTALCMLFNNTEALCTFVLPQGHWSLRMDTAAEAGEDLFLNGQGHADLQTSCEVAPRSLRVLSSP